MRKIIVVVLALMLGVVPVVYGQAGEDVSELGNECLLAQQADNGSFEETVELTAVALIALSTMEEPNTAGLAWLEENTSEALTLREMGLAVLALTANGVDTGDFADGVLRTGFPAALRNASGDNIDDMCIGLMAWHNMGFPPPAAAISVLKDAQNEDGGFGQSADSPSNPISSSYCLQLFTITEEAELVSAILTYLADAQLQDGGWSADPDAETVDPLATSLVLMSLMASGETWGDWGHPQRGLLSYWDESGRVGNGEDLTNDIMTTAFSVLIFDDQSLVNIGEVVAAAEERDTTDASGVPILDDEWQLVGDGFGIELDSADDFFVTVVDPFTDDELYGAEIINWTSDYKYTPYIVEEYMTADVLLWMAEQDPEFWNIISDKTLSLLQPEVLAQLPEEVQARVAE